MLRYKFSYSPRTIPLYLSPSVAAIPAVGLADLPDPTPARSPRLVVQLLAETAIKSARVVKRDSIFLTSIARIYSHSTSSAILSMHDFYDFHKRFSRFYANCKPESVFFAMAVKS